MSGQMKEWLPIGSVVLLRGGTTKLMIFGIRQIEKESGEEYDYVGVIYPEGNLGPESQFCFSHDSIEQVVFRGYEDEERQAFLEQLAKYDSANNKADQID